MMNLAELQRLLPYQHLDRATLAGVARYCREVPIPSARWLLRPGDRLRGACYLLTGTAELEGPRERVLAGTPRARRPIYPGPRSIRVAGPARVLRVDTAAVAPLLEARPALPVPARASGEDWVERFLARPALAALSAVHWQRLLRAMTPVTIAAGDWLLHEGESGQECYVVRTGSVGIFRGASRLALAGPGDLFGEDALVTGRARNASARALVDCRLMALPAGDFRDWLLEALADWQRPPLVVVERARQLSLPADRLHFWRFEGSCQALSHAEPAASCDPARLREQPPPLRSAGRYLITGASPGQRALAALLFTGPDRGFLLAADQARTVRSAAQARSA